MSEKISNSSILDIFDSFLSDVNSALAYKSSLEEENRILKYDTDSCIADIQRKDETILGKEEEIARLLEKHLTTTKSHSSKISETKNDIRASTQLVEIRYEVEILLSNQRALGRELSAQRTENERLQRFNQQLTRELSIVKSYCLDLEKGNDKIRRK